MAKKRNRKLKVSGGNIYDDLIKQRQIEIDLLEKQRTTRNKIRSLERKIRSKRRSSNSPKSPRTKQTK
jgi:hypothetical protein